MDKIETAKAIALARSAARRAAGMAAHFRDDLVSEAVLAALTGDDVENAVRRLEGREFRYRRKHRSLDQPAYIAELQRRKGGGAPERARVASSIQLYEALKALSPRQYMAVTLKFFGGYTEEEIGAEMGIAHQVVGRHIAKALGRMRDVLSYRVQKEPPERINKLEGSVAASVLPRLRREKN